MKRKIYIIITLIIVFIMCSLGWIYEGTNYENIVLTISQSTMALWFLYTAYLLIVKKSYNLLAGMSEETALEIKNKPEEEKKIIKTAKIVGYISIIISLILLLSLYFLIR